MRPLLKLSHLLIVYFVAIHVLVYYLLIYSRFALGPPPPPLRPATPPQSPPPACPPTTTATLTTVDNALLRSSQSSPPHDGCQLNLHVKTCEGSCRHLKDFLAKNRNNFWSGYYPKLVNFMRMKKSEAMTAGARSPLLFVEIGTAYGGLAAYVLRNVPGVRYVAVDPFLAGYDEADGHSQNLARWAREMKMDHVEFSRLWARAMDYDIGGRYPTQYHLIHDTSVGGATRVEDGTVDVIFVDGLHTEEGVRADLKAWIPKMRREGILIFNDYRDFPGVHKVVVEYANRTAQPINLIDGNNAWLWAMGELA